MGFVPGYENDIFISYSHIDNDPIIKGKMGWVDNFVDLLRKRLRVKLGGEVRIFFDKQLRHYGTIDDQLASQLSSSAVFICIVSPRYVVSDSCLSELGVFLEQSGNDRIIKVEKTALDEQSYTPKAKELFAKIRAVLNCSFYTRIEGSNRVTDLQPEVITDHIPSCIEKIDVIVQDVIELLKNLRVLHTSSSSTPGASAIEKNAEVTSQVRDSDRISVYLAETTNDLAEVRNRVKTELLQFNCSVLPDQPLPQEVDALVTTLRDYLQQARLSVHLIGANYGVRPELEERSVPHIQYDVAAELSRAGQPRQLVWMPDGISAKEGNQQRFVDYVKNNAPDFLRTKLEDLKTEILKKLKPASTNGWDDNGEGDPVNVSLFCHEQDMKSVAPLYTHLKVNELFKVKLPLKDVQSSQSTRQDLQASDAVLLYYGTADEDWFANIWKLIQRHTSTGRTKPVLAKAIYAGLPSTTEKDLLELESTDLVIIKNYDLFNPSCLSPFIARIKAAKGSLP